MKYEVTINGKTLPVTIDEEGCFQYRINIDGREKFIDAHRTEACVYSILVNGKSYEVDITQDGEEFVILIDGETHRVSVTDEKRKSLRNIGASQKDSGARIIFAPMPGRVVRILKNVGDMVEKNQGVIVVEAMKMENELKSGSKGVVKNIFVKEGDTVEAGQKLVDVG